MEIPKPGYYILSAAPTVGLIDGAPIRVVEHKGHSYAVGAFDPGYPVKFLLGIGVTFTPLYTQEEMDRDGIKVGYRINREEVKDEPVTKVQESVQASAERLDGTDEEGSEEERGRYWDRTSPSSGLA